MDSKDEAESKLNVLPKHGLTESMNRFPVLKHSIREEEPKKSYRDWASHSALVAVDDIASSGDGFWATSRGGVLEIRPGDQVTEIRRHYSEHGLPGSRFSGVFVDLKSRPWIFGGHNRVSYFDGEGWKCLAPFGELKACKTLCCQQDRKGRLWVGTDKGLGYFEPCENGQLAWTTYDLSEANMPGAVIKCLDFGPQEQMIVGTPWGAYLRNGNSSSWSRMTRGGGLPSQEITSVLWEDLENIWIGTSNGLVHFSEGSGISTQFAGEKVIKVTRPIEGLGVLVATSSRLRILRNGILESLADPPEVSSFPQFRSAIGDEHGRIIAGLNVGVVEYQPSRRMILEADFQSPPNEAINSIAIDLEGNVWIGSASGARIYRRDTWRHYQVKTETISPIRNVSRLLVTDDGTIWIGSWEKGRWGGLRATKHHHSLRMITGKDAPQFVDTMCSGEDEELLIGAGESIYTYHRGTWSVLSENPSPGAVINALAAIDGTLWCGSSEGLYRLTDGIWHKVSDLFVNAIETDNKGDVYIGTKSGAYLVNESNLERLETEQESANVLALLITKNGNVWYGSDKELGVISMLSGSERWTVKNSGLADERVFALAFDEAEECIWIGTGNGISQFHIPEKYSGKGG